jgi:hypothetical protein
MNQFKVTPLPPDPDDPESPPPQPAMRAVARAIETIEVRRDIRMPLLPEGSWSWPTAVRRRGAKREGECGTFTIRSGLAGDRRDLGIHQYGRGRARMHHAQTSDVSNATFTEEAESCQRFFIIP